MMDWGPYYKRVLALEAQGLSHAEIAAKLQEECGEEVTRHAVRHALERAREVVSTFRDSPKPDRTPYLAKYEDYILGKVRPEPKNWEARASLLRKKRAKVLVHGDLHIPFQDDDKVNESFNKHIDADGYICNADVLDAYDHSSFDKGMSVPFEFELDETLRYFEYVNDAFPISEILEANHECRIRRQIERNLAPSLQFLAQKNILEVLARPFPNIIIHSNLWWFKQGSVIYAHPSKASKIELRAPMEVYRHFVEWEEAYGIGGDWNAIIVGHTHQGGVGHPAKAKVIECPCLSKTAPYVLSPKIPYNHPAVTGYTVVTLNEGVCDWNETREYRYPPEVIL